MRSPTLTVENLHRELTEWREHFPRLKDDELFVAWFLRAFIVDEARIAAASLTGGGGDKDADAVYIDERARIVFIVQGKFRHKLSEHAEARTDVKSFAELAPDLCGEDELFAMRVKSTSPRVGAALQEARRRIRERGYFLKLCYVTLGRITPSVRSEALSIARRHGDVASIDFFDGHQVLLMLSDYLDGVAPPIPILDLPMEAEEGAVSNGALNRKDNKTGIEAWVFTMTSRAIAEVFDQTGTRVFARNVRGFLGSTEINASMQETLETTPAYFWYYNNGITIICDAGQVIPVHGVNVLRVKNPQIINGQQTTRMLHAKGKNGRGAGVLVRVFCVPRKSGEGSNGFETLVSNIVQATNWQNAIRASDLMSNDRRQIEIERQLRKFGYLYVRKRQTKGEVRRTAVNAYSFILRKDEIAQAVAACNLDPAVVREGKENLFEERWYSQIFPNLRVPRHRERADHSIVNTKINPS